MFEFLDDAVSVQALKIAGLTPATKSPAVVGNDGFVGVETPTSFRALIDAERALSNPPTSGWVLSSSSAGVRSWVAPNAHSHVVADVAGLTGWATKPYTDGSTSDVAEGTRLYFTDARARSAVAGFYLPLAAGASNPLTGELYASQGVRAGTNMILRDLVTWTDFGAIYGSAVTPTADNYLLAFLRDGSQAYFNATGIIGLDINGVDMVLATSSGVALAGAITTPLATGFVRSVSGLLVSAGLVASEVSGLTGWATKAYTDGSTTDVAEGTNLYYTDARSRAAHSATSPISYNSSTGVISHLAGDGQLHVPATSTTNNGRVLMAGSTAGSFAWTALSTANISGLTGWATKVYSNGSTTDVAEGTNLYYTDTRSRAAHSATAPISYNSSTGVISHATSGVTAGTYGSATQVPVIVYNATGHATGVTVATITPAGIGAAPSFVSAAAALFWATPAAASGVPSLRAIVATDLPASITSNTTGSAAKLTTPRTFTIGSTGRTFDGTANVSWALSDIGAAPRHSVAANVLLKSDGSSGFEGTDIVDTGSQITISGLLSVPAYATSAGLPPILFGTNFTSTADIACVGIGVPAANTSGLTRPLSIRRGTTPLFVVDDMGNTNVYGALVVTGVLQFSSLGAGFVKANASGIISSASILASDVPTLNQSTTGSAATLTTARTLTIGSTGKTFNGSANVSWSLAEIGAQAAGSYLATTGGTMTGNVTFSDDGEGVFFNSGAGIYKKSGTGIVIRLHTANTNLQIENNAGAVLGSVWYGTGGTLNNLNQLTNGPGYITASSLAGYLPLTGGALSTSTSSNLGVLSVTNTITTSHRTATFWGPNTAAGSYTAIGIGVADSQYNSAFLIWDKNATLANSGLRIETYSSTSPITLNASKIVTNGGFALQERVGVSTYAAIYGSGVTPSSSNYALAFAKNGTSTNINGTTDVYLIAGSSQRLVANAAGIEVGGQFLALGAEAHFGNGSYTDPQGGQSRDAKFGNLGISTTALYSRDRAIVSGGGLSSGAGNWGLTVGSTAYLGAGSSAALGIGIQSGYGSWAFEIDASGSAVFGVDASGSIAKCGSITLGAGAKIQSPTNQLDLYAAGDSNYGVRLSYASGGTDVFCQRDLTASTVFARTSAVQFNYAGTGWIAAKQLGGWSWTASGGVLPGLGVNEWCFLICDQTAPVNSVWVTNSTQSVRIRSGGTTYTTSAGGATVQDSAGNFYVTRTTCILIGPTDAGSSACSLIPF